MLVLDSSYLVALFNRADALHEKALEKRLQIPTEENLLLPEYVALELATILGIRGDISISSKSLEKLLTAKEVIFVPCSEFFMETLKEFSTEKKFALSFVDCALLVIAKTYEADEILTFDANLQSAFDSN